MWVYMFDINGKDFVPDCFNVDYLEDLIFSLDIFYL